MRLNPCQIERRGSPAPDWRWRSVRATISVILLGFAARFAAAGAPATKPTLTEGDRVGVVAIMPSEASHQYVGITVFSNVEPVKIPITWDINRFLGKRMAVALSRLKLQPIIIAQTPETLSLRDSVYRAGVRKRVPMDAAAVVLDELRKTYDLAAVIVIRSYPTNYMRWADVKNRAEEMAMDIDGFGTFARQAPLGLSRVYAFANVNVVLLAGPRWEFHVLAPDAGIGTLLGQNQFPADLKAVDAQYLSSLVTIFSHIGAETIDDAVAEMDVRPLAPAESVAP